MTKSSVERLACPCCGYGTLAERNAYECCPICWWEDDGQDSKNADEVLGGPNADLSLTQARINFLKFGIAFPDKKNLKPKPRSGFQRLRHFQLTDENTINETKA